VVTAAILAGNRSSAIAPSPSIRIRGDPMAASWMGGHRPSSHGDLLFQLDDVASLQATLKERRSPPHDGLGRGLFTVVVTAVDRAGNATQRTARFSIDLTPPAITISGVTDGAPWRPPSLRPSRRRTRTCFS